MPLFGKRRKPNHLANSYDTVALQPSHPSNAFPSQSYAPYPGHANAYSDVRPSLPATPASTELVLISTFSSRAQPADPVHLPRQKWTSCSNLPSQVHQQAPLMQPYQNTQYLYDTIGDSFSDIVFLVDEGILPLGQKDFVITLDPPTSASPPLTRSQDPLVGTGPPGDQETSFSPDRQNGKQSTKQPLEWQNHKINVLSKVLMYGNARLPVNLPPLRLYMASWPLICLAAEYSRNAYKKPSPAEKDFFINANVKLGTKAMVVKSVPMDDAGLIVFAIRGTSLLSLRDWGVNMSTTPISPAGFLDDSGNLCHEGFLRVARAMLVPIAARLRHLLEENPSRTSCSLLITGHSAGGAVASLLYTHMLSSACPSELSILTGCFKRIHCVTFGAPPVSLLPLWKPAHGEHRLRKSLFLSFINEGDVVCRAEKAYIRSLVELLASPVPDAPKKAMLISTSRVNLLTRSNETSRPPNHTQKAVWKIPPATLSNAGRLVLLRMSPKAGRASRQPSEDITASVVTDEQLRTVIWGDPLVHTMEAYANRVEVLATKAVKGHA